MKVKYRVLIVALIAVLALDTLGSIASRQWSFNYSSLATVSYLILFATGFFATRDNNLKTGVLFAALVGLFDSTIGWKLSMMLNATGSNSGEKPVSYWIATALVVTSISALFGLVGGGFARIVKK